MKNLRWIIPVVLVALVAAFAWQRWSSSGGQTSRGSASTTLRYGFEVETTVLDPSKVADAYISRVLGQIFEGLTALDDTNEVVPCLAESWRQENDGKTWIFKLRDGVQFHPSKLFGEKKSRMVEAADVEFSFTRLLAKGSTSGYAIENVLQGSDAYAKGESDHISGIRVLGPNEIAFDLLSPDPLFPRRLTSVILAVLPREAAKLPAGNDFGKDVIVGTGPYQVESRSDTGVQLVKNTAYWRKVPGNVERIVVTVMKNDALRLAAARNGELDLTYVPLLLAPTVAEAVGDSYKLKTDWKAARLEVHRTFNSTFLGLNCEHLDAPFRRALSEAVDRTALAKLFLPGTVTPTVGPVPLAFPGYKEPVGATRKPDLEAARQSLAASSKKGQTLEILVHDKEASEQVGQLLQAQFAAAGINVKLTKLDYGAVLQRMAQGDYDGFLMSFEYVYSTPMPILEGLLNSARIPSPNFWRYRNAEVDIALKEFQKAESPAAANEIAARIVGMLQQDPAAIYLYQTLTPVVVAAKLDNVPINGHSVPMLWQTTMK